FIKAGEFAVLAGPSGSGKTTVLNIIGALDTATEGAVAVDSVDFNEMKPKQLADFRLRRIGFIFQS
ncbi:MAG: ATP-binding cassette domain-containing protein, partial [Desulfuromonadales bacterium]|nr:ATP-binding cassette domain-containing protein [Desulfuromonadales bacterium]NIS41586.1 ATP-binding cassette domain-containing protein [Desulfuromonadales bacterium]